MADDKKPLNAKIRPAAPLEELGFLDATGFVEQDERCEAATVAPRPETPPGRRPLFRN